MMEDRISKIEKQIGALDEYRIDKIEKKIASLSKALFRLTIGTKNILEGAVTSSKIDSLDVGKLTAGSIDVGIGITTGGYIKVGTGVKDSTLTGFIIDDTEFVAQVSGVDKFKIVGSTGLITVYAGNAIDGSCINDGTITAAKIVAGTITANEIAADTITAGNIAASAIGTDELAANSVTSAKIAANTIEAGDIKAGTITTTEIAADTITGGNIAAGTITASEIAASTITTTEIAANTITAGDIAAGTLTATEISANTITANKFNLALHYVDGTFTDNSPSAGYVAWASCTVTYNGTTYTITNGNTNSPIIWWDLTSPTAFQTAATYPSLDTTDDIIVGWNSSGMFVPLWQTRSVHGENIVADTITASTLSTISADMGTLTAGIIKMGTGTKDSTLTGFQIDSTELVGQASGVDQVVLSASTGILTAGGGNVTLDASGITLVQGTGNPNKIKWLGTNDFYPAFVYGTVGAGATNRLGSAYLYGIGEGDTGEGKGWLVATNLTQGKSASVSVSSIDGIICEASTATSNRFVLENAIDLLIYSDAITTLKASIDGATGNIDTAGSVATDTIAEHTAAAGVTIDGVKLKDSQPYCDAINEKTATAGVTVDGVLLKDGLVDGVDVSALALTFVRADKNSDGDYDPLTSTSWDGDGYSTGTGTINWNSVFGVPTTAKAVLLDVRVVDASGTGRYIGLRAKSTTTLFSFLCRTVVAGVYHNFQGVVPIAADGTSYYSISASGTGTLGVYMVVVGWYI